MTPWGHFNHPKNVKRPPKIVIFQKFLDFAENLRTEYFDGAEFIFDVILTPKVVVSFLTPQNVKKL